MYEYVGNTPTNITKGKWTEQHLYGSSRLGMLTPKWDISNHLDNDAYQPNAEDHTQDIGKRIYELTNHLGNVMATVSDKKIGHDNGSGTIDYYEADVVSANDYYPFGMSMPGRGYNAGSYRYGFQNQEKDNEIYGEGNAISYK